MSSKRDGPNPLHGILLIDKPAGWTSHDVVARVRRLTGQRKAGHTGTLDPMATGLLVVCLGDATRLVEYMTGHDKRYEGVVRLGVTTDTDDADGRVIAERPVPPISQSELDAALRTFEGSIDQRPPAFSALKVGGQRAYAIARKGDTPELAARSVTVYSITGQPRGDHEMVIRVHCGAGTYIRSIARDLGERLGCGGHLTALRRLAAGGFSIAQAVALDAVEAAGPDRAAELLWAADEAIAEWPAALLDSGHMTTFLHGTALSCATIGNLGASRGGLVRVFGAAGDFVGVGRMEARDTLQPVKVMAHAADRVTIMSRADSHSS